MLVLARSSLLSVSLLRRLQALTSSLLPIFTLVFEALSRPLAPPNNKTHLKPQLKMADEDVRDWKIEFVMDTR